MDMDSVPFRTTKKCPKEEYQKHSPLADLELYFFMINKYLLVPDRRRWIHLEVVLVRRWAFWVLGIWKGEGGKGEVSLHTINLKPRWADPVTARRVPSK
jgi:hypothetical protein